MAQTAFGLAHQKAFDPSLAESRGHFTHHQLWPSLWLRAGRGAGRFIKHRTTPLGTLHASAPSSSSLPTRRVSPGRYPDSPKQRLLSYEAGEVGEAQLTKGFKYTLS